MKKRMVYICGIFPLILLYIWTPIATAQNRFNMSYLYFGRPDTYVDEVNGAQNAIGMVAPNYFDLNTDGTLVVKSNYSKQFVDEMHSRGIKVVPFVSNNYDRTLGRAALTNRETLSTQIASAVQNLSLDGVDIDIENLTNADRDNNTDLMRLLRNKIPTTKQVSIAVAANPYGWTTGWQGSYDYAKLAQVLTGTGDYLMIMAYDESWEGSDPGPVSSLSFFEKSIVYALNKGVPSSKVVVGLPFYGRVWKLEDYNKRQTDLQTNPSALIDPIAILGTGIPHSKVATLQTNYHGQVTFDTPSQTPLLKFTIQPGDPSITISFKQFTQGNYVLWYDNEPAIKKKLELVQKYNLKGTGSWSLSLEDPAMWSYYSNWLNGLYATPGTTPSPPSSTTKPPVSSTTPPPPTSGTETHFADVPSGNWAENYIYDVESRGWMLGTGDSNFSPDAPLSRAQGATILVRALGYDQASPTTSFPFTDVPSNYWARKYIHLAKEKGLINGISETTFEPDAPLTREQMAKMLNNLLKYANAPLPAYSPYADLSTNRWSYQSIINMTQKKVFSGFVEGSRTYFKPEDQTTRAQMATLMSRLGPDIDKLK